MSNHEIKISVDSETVEVDELATGIPVVSLGDGAFKELIAQLNLVVHECENIPQSCTQITLRAEYKRSVFRGLNFFQSSVLLVTIFGILALVFLGVYKFAELFLMP